MTSDVKIVVAVLCLLIFNTALRAQRLDSAHISKLPPEKQEQVYGFLQQARAARNTAIILAMAGGSAAIAGMVYSIASDINTGYYDDTPSYNSGTKIAVLGAMVGLSSIPFFIKFHNRRSDARAVFYAGGGSSRVLIPGTQSAGVKVVLPLGR